MISNLNCSIGTICLFSKVISNFIFNSSSNILKGVNVPEVKIILYGSFFIISENSNCGLKQ